MRGWRRQGGREGWSDALLVKNSHYSNSEEHPDRVSKQLFPAVINVRRGLRGGHAATGTTNGGQQEMLSKHGHTFRSPVSFSVASVHHHHPVNPYNAASTTQW
ncbi:hypothetical protein E2C01_047225 [Portunus trituberculatus]|uniref:Uncharacterized protein n=1 Tax=Portunus trituberculatus TaxID=210409 RepID=A0A5B7G763_PORTR|nr:hypothetical protein [Portunus trituberculatus]